ncbi:hypothetical protein [Shewanella algidipiscicola]|uniref:Uncharacterized protein n=1 Tax=Shewanella algidipiscicola TaxID=614070 RepID=A0ABQ4PHA0_9GAMM|nr:hypothetical protein [Shewanella algidipiscicola]GIU46481.1 hypothetical protein TUM4630_17080 [Shewanella algidipiscicola]
MMSAIYCLNLAGGAEQTEIANYFPVVCPSGQPTVVQNRSRRFCVRRVEELFAFADKVEAQVSKAQARVNNLTQSILAKAFRGELTAEWREQNPELIRGENSALALLERIKAEREALALAAKAAKKKPRAKKAKS